MALATTCPACSTSFKVNPEQLKLRRGLVRCGNCEHVFSGVEYLRYVSDSRTDEELNEDNDGQDRRRGDRRGTGRRLWGNSEPSETSDASDASEPSATDELKTAFFLPDTELGPGESATEGPGNTALKSPPSGESEPTSTNSDAPSADKPEPQAKPASENADAQASGDSASPPEPSTGKRSRRGGARGKRGRGRRKRAAREQAEQSESNKESTQDDAANSQDQKKPADAELTTAKASKSSPDDADAATSKSAGEPDADDKSSDKHEKSGSQKPSPFSPSSQTRAGAVITSPLTKGARGDFQRAGRDDDWASAPVWPKIDEHFDEPDIEEPDSRPGPGGAESADAADSSSEAKQDSEQTDRPAKSAKRDPAERVDDEDLAASPLAAADNAGALHQSDGLHEEDAIDFFGKTSRPSFDFDLPPRQVLIIAAGLVVLLILQLAIGNRDVLASRFPSISSGLAAISAPFGLEVRLPMNREEIKIASFDLTAASSREPDASYVMNLLMRNNARYKLRWPAIELTLLDGVGGILVRKVLMPAQYLSDESMISAGLASNSEQPIRVALKSTTDAPVGYSVSLFYP
ncbi:MAG: DUF3426 domain-containing protein [Burkholderiaceae bacterium]